METLTMAIPESLMKDNYFIPVDNSPEKAEENGYVQDKPSFTSSSAKKTSGSSKDEAFFDTNQWLQSDSEDDFFSVNGEFTPSRGNTPKCSFSDKHPRFHNPLFEEEKPRAASFSYAPAPRRKKLAELFRESDTTEYKSLKKKLGPSVVTGHKGNNTTPGQRRRSRKREFPIWNFEKVVYETVQAVRASSGTRGDQHVGGSGGGRKRTGRRRHDEREESPTPMKLGNLFKGKRAEQMNGSCGGDPWRCLT
uniref:Uncharacterized protein n=1 Tax=Brassica campestris TaxID=3711 RepID=M4E9T3_BRACM